ncbi:hypothetical protein INT47_005113 [Mucor saturninus]|uniref:Uncharacterized protein n=1 Tax=Mucor saturninus TaxID=64648 RepID=A0A8H7QUP6_9FUNG|nr:hypothetical protein INT47_005113 [Mucor saturninus]
MLTSFKKKKMGAVVAPQQQQQHKLTLVPSKSTPLTQYFQKKLTIKQAKRLLQKMVPVMARSQKTIQEKSETKNTSTVLFDSSEDLHTPPTPPPKKSQTMPDLSNSQDSLVHRALPSLPSVASYSSSSDKRKKNGLTRATTWVGHSIQKWLSSTEAKESRKMAILINHSVLEEEEEHPNHLSPN